MLPWFGPGLAISVVVSLAASGAVGRALGVHRAVAWVMLLSLGIIMAATLTPRSEALGSGARGSAYCDFSRIGLASWEQLISANEASGNVLMFIPLGAAIGLLPTFAIADDFRLESPTLPMPLTKDGKVDVVIEASGVEPIGDGHRILVAHDKHPALFVVIARSR